jgi:hypothetical protein
MIIKSWENFHKNPILLLMKIGISAILTLTNKLTISYKIVTKGI